jgi:hypothetical protein
MPAYVGMPAFPVAAKRAVADSQLRRNLTHATTAIRTKRATAIGELGDWQELRQAAKEIKDHVLANLDTYLLRLEENVTRAGGQVHYHRRRDRPGRAHRPARGRPAQPPWASAARTSRWPAPARSWSSNRKATAACA